MNTNDLPLFPRTFLVLRRSALEHNVRWLRARLPAGTRLLAVVKANAYGHGASLVGPMLDRLQVDALGVATTAEALELRAAGVTKPIYLLSPILPEESPCVVEANAVCLLQDIEFARTLSEEAVRQGVCVRVHLKVDVGLSRFGVRPECAERTACELDEMPGLELTGIATHFSCADSNPDLTRRQWQTFASTAERVMQRLGRPLLRHAAASAGVLSVPEACADMVRCGLLVYGMAPSGRDPQPLGLQPVLSLHTRVVSLRRISPGVSVSYGATFTAQRETLVATVPVGYGDGYVRALSNRAQVLLRGRRVPVLGRVCMDQMMIDATDTGAEIGDLVTLIGRQGDEEITVNEIAGWIGTTPHEVTTLLSARVQRIPVD